MKSSLTQIESFLASKKMAVAGVSRDPKKFSHQVYTELKDKGYSLFPINPHAKEISGDKCYNSVEELPKDVENLYIVTTKDLSLDILQQGIKKGMQNFWVQQMSETPELIEFKEKSDANIIIRECMFMFANGKGIHKFHASIKKLFGAYPK